MEELQHSTECINCVSEGGLRKWKKDTVFQGLNCAFNGESKSWGEWKMKVLSPELQEDGRNVGKGG